MSTQPREEFKNMMNALVDDLKRRGLNVSGAAILDLAGSNEKKEKIDQEVKNALNALARTGVVPQNGMPTGSMNKDNGPRPQAEFPGKCFCPVCFNFDTFESVLGDLGGNFDYTSVVLGGRQFDIKYWASPAGKEKIIIAPHKVNPATISYENFSLENLQEALNIAVNSKDFTEAQVILDVINKNKNKE